MQTYWFPQLFNHYIQTMGYRFTKLLFDEVRINIVNLSAGFCINTTFIASLSIKSDSISLI